MPTFASVIRKLRWSVTQRGVVGTLKFALARVVAAKDGKPRVHPFDRTHGVDTSGLIGGADLTAGHIHDMYNTAYYGMSPSRFRGAIELWSSLRPVARVEQYSFVDLGCGKGRALLLATEVPFREAVGVELNPQLAEIAEANMGAWQGAGRGQVPVRVVCSDAIEFTLPAGPCLLYLFNPFAQPVVEELVRKLAVAFQDRPGLLDVIYFNPEGAAAFLEEPGFDLLWSGTIAMSAEDAAVDLVASPDDQCHLYRWLGAGVPGSPSVR